MIQNDWWRWCNIDGDDAGDRWWSKIKDVKSTMQYRWWWWRCECYVADDGDWLLMVINNDAKCKMQNTKWSWQCGWSVIAMHMILCVRLITDVENDVSMHMLPINRYSASP